MMRLRTCVYVGLSILLSSLSIAAHSDAPSRIKLAVFDFELEDYSAGAGITAGGAADRARLQTVSDEIRHLIVATKRYDLVDVANITDPAVTGHELRHCHGCDAQIAERIGARQSMTGIVSRISRTEYQVSYTIRDASSGRVLAAEQTDLRIGADYSWNRGAAWLVKNKLFMR